MYSLTQSGSILRADGANIPADESNRDYHAYLAWVAEGNTPAPYVPPVLSLRQESDIVLQRMTPEERDSLFTARRTSATVDYFITRASSTGIISEADPDFPSAVAALNAAGIVAAERWPDLLAP
jgi:hypothetical protein